MYAEMTFLHEKSKLRNALLHWAGVLNAYRELAAFPSSRGRTPCPVPLLLPLLEVRPPTICLVLIETGLALKAWRLTRALLLVVTALPVESALPLLLLLLLRIVWPTVELILRGLHKPAA